MKISLMLALFFILHAVALAQDASCPKITNDLDRLACYDKASGRIPTATIEPAPPGKWQITTEKSKLTDRTSVFLSVQSNEIVDCGWNKGDKLNLYIRCHENQTDLLFVTQCHMTSSDYNSYGQINYRIDADKARKVEAEESTDNKSLGLWGGTKSIPVIKQMIGKNTLIAQMTPYGENPFTATFDISGLDQAISQLRKECSW